jgi:geranylgeranyl pyrophosphate synthase
LQVHSVTLIPTEDLKQAVGLAELTSELQQPTGHLLSTNGKQLRSGVLIACAQASRRPDDPEVEAGAIAIELFQLATLAHDDVVDNGALRRGTETVVTAYGNNTSGFVGGALFTRALELMTVLGNEPTVRFAQMASEVCLGQMKESEDLYDADRSPARYYETITGKTASLFDLAAWLGAWLAGADDATTAAYARFGREFGVAFQIADDILDLVATEAETGKSPAQDLRHGVYNLPVLHAIAADTGLREALSRESIEDDIDALVTRIQATGGIESAISECRLRAESAASALRDGVELRPPCIEAPIALLYQALDPALRLGVQANAA